MKNLYTRIALLSVLLITAFQHQSKACYATYVHTNACAGDTVWFYGLDVFSVHTWDLGDSTLGIPNMAYGDTAFHVYTKPGTYYVTHFVNIGAEWAFETQVITVGTVCFKADFSSDCVNTLHHLFANKSVGSHLKYSWNFGDPGSGTYDTTSQMGPYHTFTAAGNFTVTLIIDDGTKKDTSVQTVTVKNTCMTAGVSYMANPCVNDTAYFYYYYTGVTSVSWNFGDPASGVNNHSTLMQPKHIFSGPGVYFGTLIISNGTAYDTVQVYTKVVDCSVWPGDADRNGIVSAEDMFALGLYYGDTGVVRLGATLNYTAQNCTDWVKGTSWGDMYLHDMVDKKHADGNGDGKINSDDLPAIVQNFGKQNFKYNRESQMQLVAPTAPALSIQMTKHFYSAGDKGFAAIDFSGADGIYGICFTIKYDTAFVDGNSVNVLLNPGCLDSAINNLQFYNNDVMNGLITIGLVKTDHTAGRAEGLIGTISCDFKNNTTYSVVPFTLTILPTAKLLTNNLFVFNGTTGYIEHYLDMQLLSDSADVQWEGIENVNPNTLMLYPSPAASKVYFATGQDLAGASLQVIDATGRLVKQETLQTGEMSLDVHTLAEGVYFLQITSNQQVYRGRFVVSR